MKYLLFLFIILYYIIFLFLYYFIIFIYIYIISRHIKNKSNSIEIKCGISPSYIKELNETKVSRSVLI